MAQDMCAGMKRRDLQTCWFGVGKSRTTHWKIFLVGFLVMVLLGGNRSTSAAESSSTNALPRTTIGRPV